MTNSEKHEAFVEACVDHDEGAVSTIIEAGLDVDFIDIEGCSALHYAASSRNITAAKMLIAHRAKVDCIDRNGNTPLWIAVFRAEGETTLIDYLLSCGADPNKENLHGVSPASLALTISSHDYANVFPK